MNVHLKLSTQICKKTISVFFVFLFLFSLLFFPDSPTAMTAAASHTKAIIFIPGIAGSSLKNNANQTLWLSTNTSYLNKLACYENGTSKNQISTPAENHIIDNLSNNIINSLNNNFSSTHDIILFKYDWRLSCATAALKLEQVVQNYSEVVFVAHSMGGLVASKFLAKSSANRAKVSKVITIGTPYTGAVKGLYVMETGNLTEILSIPLVPLTNIQTTIKNLVCNFPAVYELLPNINYLNGNAPYITATSNGNTQTKTTHYDSWSFMKQRPWGLTASGQVKQMFNNAESFHSSLYVNNSHIANGNLIEYHMIIGFGKNTPSTVVYKNGKISKYKYENNGDGTVTTASAVNNRGSNTVLHVRASHLDLIKNTTVINKVIDIIRGYSSSIPSTSANPSTAPLQTNEKGWLIDEDNDRTEVLVYSGSLGRLKTSDGMLIEQIGDTLYYQDENGDSIEYGTVWCLEDGSYQYEFYNNDFSFVIMPNQPNTPYSIEISYMSDGYYTKSVYRNNETSVLGFNVSSNVTKTVACTDAEGNTCSLSERDADDLSWMNQ